jgi:superfamily II DNA or RNA helicase
LVAKIGKKSIVYVVGKDLLHQIYNLFVSIFGADCVGRIGDGICDIRDITIATVWSIGAALGKPEKSDEDEPDEESIDLSKREMILSFLKEVKLHIFDEAHQGSCNTIQSISKNIFPEYIYGFSATPHKGTEEDMLIRAVFGDICYNLSARRLIDEGYLIEPDIRFYALNKYPKKKEQYQTVYSDYIVNNEQRNKLIIKANKSLIEQGFKPLTLFKTIKHGKILFDLAKDLNLGLLSGVDSSKKRQKVQDLFLEGKINGIIASTIFDCGVDIPSLSGLILSSSGKSMIRCLQRTGRILRPSPNKQKCVVVDFIDDAPYLYDHSCKRRQILSTEFNVKWPA